MMIIRKKHKGITLIELMISITITTILLAGVATIYISTRKSNTVNSGMARVQENMRFVADMMAQDIRMAGYVGCRGFSLTNALSDITSPFYDIDTPLHGYEGDTDISGFPTEYKANAIVGSDSIIVLRGDDNEFRINSHNPNSATFSLVNVNTVLNVNDIVIATDCFHSSVFQVTNANPGVNSQVTHNTGAVSQGPGNCWKRLGPVGTPRPACSASNGTNYTYAGDGKLLKLTATAYYIGVSSSGQTRSLYRNRVNLGVLGAAEELIEGVENMQIMYGEDTNNNSFANRYVNAADVSDWDSVVSVRIGFLLATPGAVISRNDTKTYTIAGTNISTGSTVSHPADQRMRMSYTMTVKLRNKGIM